MLRSFFAFLFVAMACLPTSANAAAVVLWPVDPTIKAGQGASAVWIENKGSDAVTLQVRTLAWKQANEQEHYAAQDDVVVSPPIATVAPGQRQLVRIIRRDPTQAAAETSYRVLVDELPAPIDPAKPSMAGAALSVQMRYSIPLFTYGPQASPQNPLLVARIETRGAKRLVVISNSGAQHARLVDLRFTVGGKPLSVLPGLVGYVLPGATMAWELPTNAPVGTNIIVNVNGGDQSIAASV